MRPVILAAGWQPRIVAIAVAEAIRPLPASDRKRGEVIQALVPIQLKVIDSTPPGSRS